MAFHQEIFDGSNMRKLLLCWGVECVVQCCLDAPDDRAQIVTIEMIQYQSSWLRHYPTEIVSDSCTSLHDVQWVMFS
jgi:hypothetical protein